MTSPAVNPPVEEPEGIPGGMPDCPAGPDTVQTVTAPFDVTGLLCAVNESNEEVEDQCLRARLASDIADRGAHEAKEALAAARAARLAHQSIQAEHPRRRAPIPRQWLIALITVGLDGLACYFAAQALDGSQAVDDFPGSSENQAAWQAHLLQVGAARAVVLTPATSSQLVSVVRQGLDGAITDTLTSVLFGPGQTRLRPSARSQLDRLLNLLQVSYPRAVASIDGYTDDLPVPGGNLSLSWHRARAVLAWLVGHGIQLSRLQAVGYGSADPVAPNTPHGQPLNRRVVVVIDPAG